MTYYIYIHKNKINGKVYIGQTKRRPEERWGQNGNGYKTQMFYKAIQKYGWDNFEHIILEEVSSQEEANSQEEYFIKLFDSTNPDKGYNLYSGGNVVAQSEVSRKKRSIALAGENNPMYNKHHTQETKQKMRDFMVSEGNPNLKPVICLNTQEIFPGSSFAAKKYNIANKGDIGQCCTGKRRTCGKSPEGESLQWQFYEDWQISPRPLTHSKTAIICLNDNKIFETADLAAQWAGLKSSGGIRECCNNGRQKTAGKHPVTKEPLRWMWYRDYTK